MKVYVDADACPVKNIIIQEAGKKEIPVILVTSISHFSLHEYPDWVETVYVDTGADAADYRIMKLAEKGDMVITQDYGIGSLALAKGCHVLHHKGFAYTNPNIDQLLQSRYLSAKERRSGKHSKGPKALTEEDREKFLELFQKYLSQCNWL